jgi:hypothetical protein
MGEDRDHHAGWLADEAAAELLLRHRCWPGRAEFVRRFAGVRPGPAGADDGQGGRGRR